MSSTSPGAEQPAPDLERVVDPLAEAAAGEVFRRRHRGRLAVREGSLTRRRTSLDPAAVISYAVERSPFQARVGLCTIVLHLGQGAGTRRVLDCSEEQGSTLLAALDAPLLGPFVVPEVAPSS